MLPVTHGVAYTKLQILLYALLLLAVSVLPFAIGMSGILYLAAAVVLGVVFLWYAVRLYLSRDDDDVQGSTSAAGGRNVPRGRPGAATLPMRTFSYSIWYLSALFAALLIDHYAVRLIAAL